MNFLSENFLLGLSILLLISLLAGSTTYRFGVPTLLLFLSVGMLAGSEGIGGIPFDDPALTRFIGIVCLNFILFSGGLDTRWRAVKPVLWPGITLSTLGVLLTAITLALFLWQILNYSFPESLLIGSIVSSTDAAAVFSILRARNMALRSKLRPLLELESGSNDPMAYVLTISSLQLLKQPETDGLELFRLFATQMLVGGLSGYSAGHLSYRLINRVKLGYEGLYPVLVIALMLLTFSGTEFLGGNGFLANYLCAVVIGNREIVHKNTVLKVFDGLAWLMQIGLFLTLGLLVFPSHLWAVASKGFLVASFLILVARPVAIFSSLAFFRFDFRCRLFIAWAGLRGAVPIVFATYPYLAGVEKADLIFNLVFFVSVLSVVVQGTSMPLVARWLGLLQKDKEISENSIPAHFLPEDLPRSAIREFELLPGHYAVKKKIMDLKIPPDIFILLIKRQGQFIRPGGSTLLQAHDRLTLLGTNKKALDEVIVKLKDGKSGSES
ncbi:MAG: potassium/proton antiporter [Flavobacteriales bacterium]|nr:potassium/proton antiporter [Flavobacteriales bacterium]MCX7650999.1 potassium/proton antiporter [Flavobacteriales bacterium]MDW8432419.1 potassium/proton antiporter [Flavobacteriales bacterium]